MFTTGGPHELRQKLINVLYLVFITLAFVYLPSEFIDTSKYLQKSLQLTAIEYQNNIEAKKSLLDEQLYLNTPLAQDYYNVMDISRSIDTAINQVHRIEALVLENVGGYNDNGYINKSKNFLLANSMLINSGMAEVLSGQVENIRQKVRSYNFTNIVPQLDSALPEKLGLKSSSGKDRTWEKFFFARSPIAVINTNLLKIKNDLLYTKYKLVDYLVSNVSTSNSGKSISILSSNSISLEVLATQNFVLGDRVAFRVILQDSTKKFSDIKSYLTKGNKIVKDLKINENGIASFVATETGVYKIIVKDSSGQTEQRIVITSPRSAFLEKTDLEVLYMGMDNEIQLQTNGFAAAELKAEIDKGEIIPFNGNYYLRFNAEGISHLKIFAVNKDGSFLVSQKSYLVKKLPDPDVLLDGRKGGDIPEKILHIQNKITAASVAVSGDVYEILSYELVKVGTRGKEAVVNRGSDFGQESRKLLREIKSGDFLIIDNIKIKGTDGALKDVAPVVYRIK